MKALFDESVLSGIPASNISIIDEYIYYIDSDNNVMCIHGFDNEKLDENQKSKIGALCKRFLGEKLSKVIDESKNNGSDSEEVWHSFLITSLEAMFEKTGFPQTAGNESGMSSSSYVLNRLKSGCISIIGLLIMLAIGCSMLGK